MMNESKLPYCPVCGVRNDFHSPNQERICAKEIAEHPSLDTLHVEIDDCSMTGKPSSKSGFYTVTMQTDPGRIVKLRLGDDALKALRDVLAVGGDCESLEIAEQPKDAVYQDGVCRDHAPWKRCKACEDIPRISSDFPADLRPTEQAEREAMCSDCSAPFPYGLQAVANRGRLRLPAVLGEA